MTLKKEKGTGVKPLLDMKDAWVDTSMGPGCNFLWGISMNHPDDKIRGHLVHTSYIVDIKENVVETKRSFYRIVSWDEKKIHPQLQLF